MSLTIDIHALQSLPPSNINRDDTGAPKTAIFGGVPRQRVSSQAWKRAIRKDFEDRLPAGTVGYRTKYAVDLVADKIVALTSDTGEAWELSDARAAAEGLFKAAGITTKEASRKKAAESDAPEHGPETGYLLFISPRQIENAATFLIENPDANLSKKIAAPLLDQDHSIDIAMFGRMLADASDFNVDASVQVAHAIGTHESEPEFDYFTAVDDVIEDHEEVGAGMIGTVQMMSSTLYRFATIDVASLSENLGSEEVAKRAVLEFVTSFITALPTGKQNTFAHNTLPDLVYITVQDTRSVSLSGAFETPIRAKEGESRKELAAQRLAKEATDTSRCYGLAPKSALVLGLGELADPFSDFATRITLPELEARLEEALS